MTDQQLSSLEIYGRLLSEAILVLRDEPNARRHFVQAVDFADLMIAMVELGICERVGKEVGSALKESGWGA